MLLHCIKYFIYITGIATLILCKNTVQAQTVISIEQGSSIRNILPGEMKWFTDTTGQLVINNLERAAFVDFSPVFFTKAQKDWNIWSNLQLENHSGLDQEFILQTNKWGFFDGYIADKNAIKHIASGSLLALEQRSQPSNVNAIRILIHRDEKVNLFLKFKAVYTIYLHQDINLQLIQRSSFEQKDSKRLLWQGLFFGIIFVLALYNLAILFGVKDISYLYYVLSVVSIGLYFAFYYGFGIEYLWPHLPLWDTFCFAMINPFTGLARILFTRTYLHTPRLLPKINKILNVLAVVCVVILFTGLACYLFKIDLLKPLVIIIGILGALVLIMMLVAGIVAYYYDHYDPAKYFISANILLVIGAIAFILRETGLITDNFFTRYLVQVGVLIQAVVLSLGLASRLNKMRLQLATETLEKERMALEKEKEKKELIEQQRQELQQQVKEKTADLQLKNTMLEETIGQVKESEHKLSQLNQVKNKLFSVVSHDLRNPLATMQSFLKLITEHHEKMSEAERKKLFFQAQQSLDNLNVLLYNLLQWSKSQMNLLQFRQDKLNVKSIIDGAVQLELLHTHMKEVRVKISVEETLAAHADKDMVEFIIRNLLSNAVKFSHRNSEIEIKAYSENKNIKIEIIDTGVGMNEIKIKKLLENNTPISRRGTEKEKGTGLGLLISKEFIEKNGGHLQIKSEQGKGSNFSFNIPSYAPKLL